MILEDVDLHAPRSGSALRSEREIDDYLDARIAEHLAEPAGRSHVVPARGRDRRAEARSPTTCAGTMVLLMIAGIDTTWSAIGASLVAPRAAPRGPEAPRHRTRADAHRGRGVPARATRRSRWPEWWPRTSSSRAARSSEGDWLLLPVPGGEPRPGGVPRRRSGACSTGPRTATPRSDSASTGASARTSPAWSCASRSRSGCARYPDFELSDAAGSPGPPVRCAAHGDPGARPLGRASSRTCARRGRPVGGRRAVAERPVAGDQGQVGQAVG